MRRTLRAAGILVGLVGLVGAPLVLMAMPAGAAGPGCQVGDIEVTNNADTGANSLRAAFTAASALPGPQTICVDSGVATITLLTGSVNYTASTTPSLTVEGNGVTVSGNGASRVIDDSAGGPLTLDQITITDGHIAGPGGGVEAPNSAVTVTNSTISGNTTTGGGGNGGGGIDGAQVTVTNSTISGNQATGAGNAGGGIFGTTVTVTGSTISGNTAGGNGGGVEFGSG